MTNETISLQAFKASQELQAEHGVFIGKCVDALGLMDETFSELNDSLFKHTDREWTGCLKKASVKVTHLGLVMLTLSSKGERLPVTLEKVLIWSAKLAEAIERGRKWGGNDVFWVHCEVVEGIDEFSKLIQTHDPEMKNRGYRGWTNASEFQGSKFLSASEAEQALKVAA